ncbi:tetratricopeptide repeat protein [Almyronema epifaneia]|uniref:Tetratricopeptide repeat protein n=1 Tax=Almyronema epifaneia S1 TaxID=2991925 RepID=A0ABW6IJL1_9CYAN
MRFWVAITLGLMLLLVQLTSVQSTPALAEAYPSPHLDQLSAEQIDTITQLRQQAFEATESGDFVAAELYWTQLLAFLPENAAIWSNRGNIKVSQNQLEAAIADFDRAIELAPHSSDPYLNRGAAYEGLGEWSKAIADYNTLLSLDANDAAAYNNRANAEAGLGQWDKAIADYQTATELAPQFAFARANYALALYQTGNSSEALHQLRSLVRKYPQLADARAALTAILWVTGQRGEAESHWVAAVGLDKRYSDLAWVAQTRRWPPAMVMALEKFLKLS